MSGMSEENEATAHEPEDATENEETGLPFDPKMFAAVTFDCYGTLIDWEQGILHALQPLFRRHGLTLSDDALLELFARHEAAIEAEEYVPYRTVLRETLRGMADEEGIALKPGDEETLTDSLGNWPAFPDSEAALKALGKRYRLAVLSNIDNALFALSAERYLGGIAQFETVVTAEQVQSYKPAPPHFTTVLERLGLAPEEVLHVAQSRYHDIAPASALGMATVWVNRRAGRIGSGATASAVATPDYEAPDLATVVRLLGLEVTKQP
ncbi:MAG: haloacid dehalogenase type II [Armatimonadaceae bacterium]